MLPILHCHSWCIYVSSMRESGEEKVCFPNTFLRFRQRCNYEASELLKIQPDGNGSMKYSKSIGKFHPSRLVLYSLKW